MANALLAYAENIDQLEEISEAIEMMAEKHVSFHILPEHYFIVKACLMASMREVLGPEVATEEVMEAWDEAYDFLADTLITREEELRQSRASAKGKKYVI